MALQVELLDSGQTNSTVTTHAYASGWQDHRSRSPARPTAASSWSRVRDARLQRWPAARDGFGGHCATVAKRLADRARAFAASTSRFFGGAVETSSSSRCCVACATSFTARWKAASLVFDGFDIPAIFRTYCRAASCTSAEVAGGSKLFKGLMFRHIPPFYCAPRASESHLSRVKLRCGRPFVR